MTVAEPAITESRSDASWLVVALDVLIVAWLALVPIGFLLWQSFSTPLSANESATFTYDNYLRAYSDPETIRLLMNSLLFAGGAATLSLVLGGTVAFLNERVQTAFRPLIYAISLVPLIMPGILFVTAWIMLASPKIGLINLLLQQLTGTDAVFVDVYSFAGMIWVDGLQHAPLAFLMMTAALRGIDPALEDAALMSGASFAQTARRITLRLVRPAMAAAFLILFVRAIESFETPALIGLPAGIEVFTASIYEAVQSYPSDIGLASAYAVILLAITVLGLAWQSWLSRHGARYATVAGKGYRGASAFRVRRGTKLIASFAFALYALLVVVLPFLVLLSSSLQRFYSVPSRAALDAVSFANYTAILNYPGIEAATLNTIVLAAAAATAAMLLSAIAAWVVLRGRSRARVLLDLLMSLPMAIPGLVIGLSIMIAYLFVPLPIYGTLAILLIAYVTRFLPYGMRFNTAALLQVHKEAEEASALSGASWFTSFRRIVLPLMTPGLAAGWLYIAIVSVRELSSSILLYSPDSRVLSVVLWELWQNGQYVQLSALGVMLMGALFTAVVAAQIVGRRLNPPAL